MQQNIDTNSSRVIDLIAIFIFVTSFALSKKKIDSIKKAIK